MTDTTYQGWKNYETWAVALWLDNDQGTHEYWREAAIETLATPARELAEIRYGSNPLKTLEGDVHAFELADRLKRELDDDMHEAQGVPELSGFYADLLNAALSEVDWLEVARHYLDAATEAAEAV